MTLKELQNMIKEELDAYVGEAEDEVAVDVDTDAGDVDAEMGDEGTEDVLRQIFDLLKNHFEGGEEMGDEEMPMDDVEGEEDKMEEADLEENSTKEAKYQKSGYAEGGKASSGANAGYGTPGGKGGTGYDASSKALQERFQKLANIIK